MQKVVNGKVIPLTEEEIQQVLWDREQERIREEERLAEEQRMEYARLRKAEYPPLEEQFDMMYHDRINGTEIWLDTITMIKAKYPKPEGI